MTTSSASVPPAPGSRGAGPVGGAAQVGGTDHRLQLYLLLGLTLLTLVAYLPALRNGFVAYDDPQYLIENAHVREGLTPSGLRWAMTAQVAANWHPLTLVSHMADVELFGLNPKGHHLTSLLLHLGAVLSLFEVLRRMTGAAPRSALVAALFAVHPTHVESVAWVAERKDVLCALFWMLTLAAYLRYTRAPSVGRYLIVAGALAASLMAKPMAVTLPFVLLLLDLWPLARWSGLPAAPGALPAEASQAPHSGSAGRTGRAGPAGRDGQRQAGWNAFRLIAEKLPLLALATAAAAIALRTQVDPIVSGADAPLALRCANALTSYVAYLGKTFDPRQLAVFYPFEVVPASRAAAAAGVLLAISALAALTRRKAPYLLVGWLWFLVTLLPVIGVLQVGWQGMADRYTYLPSIGLYIAMVWGIAVLAGRWRPAPADRSRRWWRWGAAAAVLALLLTLTALTRRQVGYWADSFTLFSHSLAVQESFLAHTNVAEELRARGDHAGALAHYRAAVRLAPHSPQAHAALGNALRAWGRPAEALAPLHAALATDPRDERARLTLAMAFDDLGHPDLAIAELRRVLALHPDSTLARRGLTELLRQHPGFGGRR